MQKRGRFYSGERGRRIKIITAFIALLILVAIAAIPPVLPLDSGGGSDITEANPSLAGVWINKTDTPFKSGHGEAVVGTDDYIYVARCWSNISASLFYRYNPDNDSWAEITGLQKGAFRTGTALAWDHKNYIYAMLGARYEEDTDRRFFYRYNISNDTWDPPLNNTPYPQGAGDAITWCNYDNHRYIYAMMGKSTENYGGIHYGYLARYDPDSDKWENLTFNPNWSCTDDGASLVWTGGNYLYALQGEVGEYKNKPHKPITNFSRYNISNNSNGTWEDMRPVPEIEGVGDGGSLLWIGNWLNEYSDYIFALGGGSGVEGEAPGYNFYAYNISNNSWENLTSIPCPIGEWVGNRLGFANGHIYYWQGAPAKPPEKWICGGDAFFMFDIDTAPTGSITVTSSPSGAGISFDGTPINAITPYTITDVEPGYHTIELSLDSYEDWSTSVPVTAGETSYVNATLTIPPPEAMIVINEIEANPPGKDAGNEWVELYNPASEDVDLTSWTLKTTHGRIGKVTCSGIIDANGYRVFESSIQWLDNEGDSVILRDKGGAKIDEVAFTDTKNDDRTWQRCPNGIDTDSYLDWEFRPSTKEYSNKCS
uniref:LTD domain-containing protein n=1 Tax=Candidatus Methanophaga sp. ANME-1 ERB7 TaxID=2759913 RepID=A0A7G9Z4F2_9EURY|nr:hypothetical protein FPOEFMDM_00049 [Methanosarcinales archaeon ANME-1 ERB7]QNO55136.1 hypothetical protein MNNOGLJF_00050 [Methanosarcinales archaeon ANME-1 ERB7]